MKNNITIDCLNSEEWENSCKDLSGFSFFSSLAWLKYTGEVFNLENIFLKINFNEKVIFISIQQKEGVGFSNFIGYGGFITDLFLTQGDISDVLKTVEEKFNISLRRVKCFPFLDIEILKKYSQSTSFVDLSIFDGTFNLEKLNKHTRYILKKKSSFQIKIEQVLPNNINDVYKIYQETTKRVGSAYVTPMELFQKLSCDKNTLFISASIEGVVRAASVFFYDETTMYYWWNMSDTLGKKHYLNYYLVEFALREAVVKKLLHFDMGSSHSESVRLFKKNWGANLKTFYLLEENAH